MNLSRTDSMVICRLNATEVCRLIRRQKWMYYACLRLSMRAHARAVVLAMWTSLVEKDSALS